MQVVDFIPGHTPKTRPALTGYRQPKLGVPHLSSRGRGPFAEMLGGLSPSSLNRPSRIGLLFASRTLFKRTGNEKLWVKTGGTSEVFALGSIPKTCKNTSAGCLHFFYDFIGVTGAYRGFFALVTPKCLIPGFLYLMGLFGCPEDFRGAQKICVKQTLRTPKKRGTSSGTYKIPRKYIAHL